MSIRKIFAAAGLEPEGVVRWGTPPHLTTPGVYIVARTASVDDRPDPADFYVDRGALAELLSRRSSVAVDGIAATEESLHTRLGQMWLTSESVLYIGLAGTSVRHRVVQYYRTPLGARSPHAGGWPIKMLAGLRDLHVHFAASADPALSEKQMIAAFRDGVPADVARTCCDPGNVLPYANLVDPGGRRKTHGITGAKEERRDRSHRLVSDPPTPAVPREPKEARPTVTPERQRGNMKGRSHFTSEEAALIRDRLRRKAGADANEQKKLRGQNRKLGFYITDFTSSADGFLEQDFEDLIAQGRITIEKKP